MISWISFSAIAPLVYLLCLPDFEIMETPLLNEHRAAHAQLAEYHGCLLPEKFSDLASEYRAAKETVAIFDTNWHADLFTFRAATACAI